MEDGLELDEISDATQRGRPRRRKNLSCLGIFACGASTLPRSGSADAEASPEQAMAAMAITPAPAPRRGAWSGALPDRKPRGSLVEQLGFKSRVFRCSSAGGSLCTTSRRSRDGCVMCVVSLAVSLESLEFYRALHMLLRIVDQPRPCRRTLLSTCMPPANVTRRTTARRETRAETLATQTDQRRLKHFISSFPRHVQRGEP